MIICPQCQTSNEVGRETCISCGSALPGLNEIVCSNCQTINPAYLPVCLECATALHDKEADITGAKNHTEPGDLSQDQPFLPEENVEQGPSEEVDWLEELKHVTGPLDSGSMIEAEGEGTPDWVEETNVDPEESGDPRSLEWLQDDNLADDLVEEADEAEAFTSDTVSSGSDIETEERTDPSKIREEENIETPTDVDSLQEQLNLPLTAELPRTMPLGSHHEIEGLPEQLAKEDLPGWMDELDQPPREPSVSEGFDNAANVPGLEELIDEVAALGQKESLLYNETLTPKSESEDILITDLPPDAPDWLVEIMDESAGQRELEDLDSDLAEAEALVSPVLSEDNDLPPETEADEETSKVDQAVAIAAAVMAAQIADQQNDDSDSDAEVIDDREGVLEDEKEKAMAHQETDEFLPEADELIAMLDELPEDVAKSDIVSASLDSDDALTSADIPDWLQAIQPKDLNGEGFDQVNAPVEADGPLAGLAGVIPVTATLSISKSRRAGTQYQLTKEQKQQIALLQRLTQGEQAESVSDKSEREGVTSIQFRLIVGTILLVVILVGLFLPPIEGIVPGSANIYVPEGAEEAFDVTDGLGGRPVLVAFEYTPAMAGELDIVAGVYLQHLSQQNSPVLTVSQVAAGVPMAERMVQQAEINQHVALGLLPGEATGVRYLGTCIEESIECDLLNSQELGNDVSEMLAQVGLIIVLAADRESLISWIEQVGSQSDVPIVAGVSQAMGPIAAPFLASGQLVGNLDGLPGAAAYEGHLGSSSGMAAELLSSTILAQWMIIIALAGASIYFGLQAARQRSRR